MVPHNVTPLAIKGTVPNPCTGYCYFGFCRTRSSVTRQMRSLARRCSSARRWSRSSAMRRMRSLARCWSLVRRCSLARHWSRSTATSPMGSLARRCSLARCWSRSFGRHWSSARHLSRSSVRHWSPEPCLVKELSETTRLEQSNRGGPAARGRSSCRRRRRA